MVQKWPFKALFWDPRLADTVMAAARSHLQIKAMALVLSCIKKKINSAIAGKAILGPIYTHT